MSAAASSRPNRGGSSMNMGGMPLRLEALQFIQSGVARLKIEKSDARTAAPRVL